MATAAAPRTAHSYGHAYRHHPYAPSSSSSSSQQRGGPKWHTSNDQPREVRERVEQPREPPSPPRSRRDNSETPPLGLGVAFGGAPGGKWWDEELPAPPSSLTSILDSFRKSGEGDRELLLSILGAKKAEEERLTALIQTRLTILQARLSIHSAAASLNAYSPMTPSSEAPNSKELPLPIMPERTPSLGSSRGSVSSTHGPISPVYMAPPPVPQLASEKAAKAAFYNLPPMHRSHSRSPERYHEARLPPVRIGDRRGGSTSPRSTGSEIRAPGLDMLLDAGMERERRDSNERK